MSQVLNEQAILKKKHPKDQNLFIFFHLMIKLPLRLRVVTIKKDYKVEGKGGLRKKKGLKFTDFETT